MLKTGKHYNDFLKNVKEIKKVYDENPNISLGKNVYQKLCTLIEKNKSLLKWYRNERLLLEDYFLFSIEKYKILIDIFDNDKMKLRAVFWKKVNKWYILYLVKEYISVKWKLPVYTTQLDNIIIGELARNIYLWLHTKTKDELAIDYLKKLWYNDKYFDDKNMQYSKKEVEDYKKEKKEKIDTIWDNNYNKLKEYINKEYFYDTKEVNVLFSNTEWLNWQFQNCKKQEVSDNKTKLLKDIWFDLSDKWRERYIKTNINLINKYYNDFWEAPVTDKYQKFINSIISTPLTINLIKLLNIKVIESYIINWFIDYLKISNLEININIVDIIEKFIVQYGLLTKKTNKILFWYLVKIKEWLILVTDEEKNKLKTLWINI